MELILKIFYLIIAFYLFLFRPACQRELNDLRSARSGAELKHGLLRIYNLCKYIIINKLFIYFKNIYRISRLYFVCLSSHCPISFPFKSARAHPHFYNNSLFWIGLHKMLKETKTKQHMPHHAAFGVSYWVINCSLQVFCKRKVENHHQLGGVVVVEPRFDTFGLFCCCCFFFCLLLPVVGSSRAECGGFAHELSFFLFLVVCVTSPFKDLPSARIC
jgi:hypothetical protein